MSTADLTHVVTSFFESYRAAFARYDADALVEYFVYPSQIISDADPVAVRPLVTREECRAGIERVLHMHRELGVVSGRYLHFLLTELSPRLVMLSLRLELQERSGAALYDFAGFYTLVLRGSEWRIAAISHNQIPRLADCVAKRRVN